MYMNVDSVCLGRHAGLPVAGLTWHVRAQDMAPMNVLQMYWLRYGGHAAFQTKDVAKILGPGHIPGPGGGTGAVAKLPQGAMLQSGEDEELFHTVIDHSVAALEQSMFMAFYSFNEADVDARDKIRKEVKGFGRFLLAIRELHIIM